MKDSLKFFLLIGILQFLAIITYERKNKLDSLMNFFEQVNDARESFEKEHLNDLLIVNVYSSESKVDPRANLDFFVKHGLHDAADFLFVDNGGDVNYQFPNKPNIFVWKRENKCFDFGTHNLAINRMERIYNRTYERFILLNMSVRGPFMPTYSTECWSDFFAGEDTFNGNVSITGSTYCCPSRKKLRKIPPYIQGMIIGTNSEGISILRKRNLLYCPEHFSTAFLEQERFITEAILNATGKVPKVTMAASYMRDYYKCKTKEVIGDLNLPDRYSQGTIQTSDVVFIKTGRGLDNPSIERYSNYSINYSSYNYCTKRKLKI